MLSLKIEVVSRLCQVQFKLVPRILDRIPHCHLHLVKHVYQLSLVTLCVCVSLMFKGKKHDRKVCWCKRKISSSSSCYRRLTYAQESIEFVCCCYCCCLRVSECARTRTWAEDVRLLNPQCVCVLSLSSATYTWATATCSLLQFNRLNRTKQTFCCKLKNLPCVCAATKIPLHWKRERI